MKNLKLGAIPSFCKPKNACFQMDSNAIGILLILDMKFMKDYMTLKNTHLTPYDTHTLTEAHVLGASRI